MAGKGGRLAMMASKGSPSGRDSEGHWDWNVESNRVHFSARWAALVGEDGRELGPGPETWLTKVHPDDLGRVSAALEALRARNGADQFDVPHRMRHRDGSYRWMSCRGNVQRNAAREATRLVGAHADVTAETVMDPVTGLPNRLLLLEHLGRSVERATRYQGFHFALLLVDLDRGEPSDELAPSVAGDPLLLTAARRLETCLRIGDAASSFRHDDMVARLEGDQFAILVDGLKEIADSTLVADRVLAELVAAFPTRDREVFLSPSVGVAVSATGYATPGAVLRDAETALHRAKLLGKTRYEVFDTAILKAVRAELQLEADFAGALERGEFQLHYQPVVAVGAHAVVGFEALARWQHPGLGLVSPLDFIPLAEKTGFILPLGLWILREACRQLKAWQQLAHAPAGLWVSVNVSPVQFQSSFVDEVTQILGDTGLDPRQLVLEVTEGVAAERPETVKTLLMQLRLHGIRISVDDFGTGHSSLARLRQFPVDCLKVDRSFVNGMEDSADMTGILATVSSMARQLGLRVVVEGVENRAQLELVRPLECDVQGFVFSKPLDAVSATALLATGLPATAGDDTAAASTTGTTAARPRTGTVSAADARPAGTAWAKPAYVAAALLVLGAVATLLQLRSSGDDPQAASASASAPALTPADDPSTPAAVSPGTSTTALPAPAPVLAALETRAPETVAATRAASAPPRKDGTRARPAPPNRVPGAATEPPDAATRLTAATGVAVPGTDDVPESEAPPPASAPAPAEAVAAASARVVHRHRLGSCRGTLGVSGDGLVYAPEGGDDKDAFHLPHGQFVHGVDGHELTIKTSDRTFRFEPVVVNGRRDTTHLTALAASLSTRR